jgi:hypothetical protein
LIQVLAVLSELLRAGLVGCTVCVLLFGIGKKIGTRGVGVNLAIAMLSPIAVSAAGLGLNYACVLVGFSRYTEYVFRAKFPQFVLAAFIEYLLYAVLLVCGVLILYYYNEKRSDVMFQDVGGFFPSAYLYRTVTVVTALFGVISLWMTVSDMILDLATFENITKSLSAVMGYLVLPYLYLLLKLFAMLLFSAVIFRKLNRGTPSAEDKK